MKMNFKKCICVMALSATVCAVGGFAFNAKSVKVKASSVTTSENVAVMEGASLRIDGTFGLRFKTSIDATYFTDTMEVHTLLARTEKLNGAELIIGATDVKDYKLDNGTKYEKDGDYYFNTVLTSIPSADYDTDISVRAYIKDGDTIVYSQTTTQRSVAQVANSALEYDFEAYKDSVAKYVVTGANMPEMLSIGVDKSYTFVANMEYASMVSEETASKLDNLYTFSYESNDSSVATVSTDGTITTNKKGNATIKASVNGLDNIYAECALSVVEEQLKWGEVLDFSNIDLSKITLLKEENTIKVTEKEGQPVVAVTTGTETTKGTFYFKAATPMAFADYAANFDYVEMTAQGDYNRGVGFWGGWCVPDGTQTYINSNKKVFRSTSFTNTSINGEDGLKVYHPNNAVGVNTMYVFDIHFGFNDIEADSEVNTTFDLTERFHATVLELKDVTFEGTAVADVQEFKPTKSGTLTFTIAKEGFVDTTFSVAVNYTSKPAYNEIIDFNNIDTTKLGGHVTNVTTGTDENGNYAQFDLGNSMALKISVAENDMARINLFDWFKIKWHWTNGNTSGSLNVQTYDANATITKTSQGVTKNTVVETTYAKDSDKNWAISSQPYLYFNNWCGNATFKLYGIEFGYNDIVVDNGDNSSVNLLTKLALSASELTNVKFNDVAVADVTAFAPTENGTLTFTVVKDGFKTTTLSANVKYQSLLGWGEALDFNNIDLTKVSGRFGEIITAGEYNGEKALIISTANETKTDMGIVVQMPIDLSTYSTYFDKVVVEMQGNRSSANTGGGFYGGWSGKSSTGQSVNINSAKNTYTKVCPISSGSAFYNEALQIYYSGFQTGGQTVYIYSIQFGFNDITTDGTQSFDLTALFRATEAELSNVQFNGVDVASKTAFTPTESGTLTFTIAKDGFKATTFTINVTKS